LVGRGYGLFESLPRDGDDSSRRLRRVSADRVLGSELREKLAVNKIDGRGKIIPGGDLSSIDLHVIGRDSDGRALGKKGTPLPERWMTPERITVVGGKEVNISHPARTLYYKLHQGRNYDFTDLDRLVETGALSEQDLFEVKQVLAEERQADYSMIDRALAPIADRLAEASDAGEVFAAFANSPTFIEHMTPEKEETLRKIAERLAMAEDRTPAGLTKEMIAFAGLDRQHDQRQMCIERLIGKLNENKKMVQARKEIGEVGGEKKTLRIEGFTAGLENLTASVLNRLQDREHVLLAISGKSGSGKSELARQLRDQLGEQGVKATVVSSDDFYDSEDPRRPQDKHLDHERLHGLFRDLQAGKASGKYEPSSVIIIEGLQTIDDKVVGQTPDMRAHVETDFSQRMGRRLVRDERIGYRNAGVSLDMLAKVAVSNPELIRKFETDVDTDHCDFVIENDHKEPHEPEIFIQNNELVFVIDGQMKESRRLSQDEKMAILALGFDER